MAVRMTVFFSDGYKKIFICDDDEDATMTRDDILAGGHQEKSEHRHVFYPPHAVAKIVFETE
jgi:hypothetical protein